MTRLKHEIRILTLFLAMAYGAWAEAQSQPRANGYSMGSGAGSVSATQTTTNATTTTTNTAPANPDRADMKTGTTLEQTAPSEVTTVNPMDPVRDSTSTNEGTIIDNRRNRALAPPASATTTPTDPATTY